MTTSNKFTIARNILKTSIEAVNGDLSSLELFEVKELMQELLDNVVGEDCVDYWFELEGGEVRIISEDHIDELWTDSLIEQVKECYDLSNVPSFVEIDWNQTAENCKVDGMAHHFSTYDGDTELDVENVYIFRTN